MPPGARDICPRPRTALTCAARRIVLEALQGFAYTRGPARAPSQAATEP